VSCYRLFGRMANGRADPAVFEVAFVEPIRSNCAAV
jgi:hypothetical protein